MTFSVAGRCARTGMFGVAITTSSIAVGSRCPHVRAGVGAVATQNITDPQLAALVLDAMQAGQDSATAIANVVKDREHIDYRQLTAVDVNGRTAHFTGGNILGIHCVDESTDCIAAGNLLANDAIASAITTKFTSSPELHLAERLITAIEHGLDSGGEAGPVHSAAIVVADKMPFPLVDLRVDWDDDNPVATLRRMWTDYEPQMLDYLNRAINPSQAPSYGVAGDP